MRHTGESIAKREIVRRRRFTEEFRRQVVKEALAPGASVSGVALKHRINTNMLFNWRRRYLRELAGVASVKLLPVSIEDSKLVARTGTPEPIPAGHAVPHSPAADCIEIDAFGVCIRLKGAVHTETLRTVLVVLSGR